MREEKNQDHKNRIIEQCIGCMACQESCRILTEINEDPASIASRGITVDEAFSCALCGKCEAVCPLGLSAYRMFEQRRIEAVRNKEMDVNEYRYLFPDRDVTVMSIFRDYYGIDYNDLNLSLPSDTAFFPGCTMLTYSPGLTRKVYEILEKKYKHPILFSECCGLPMYQIGLPERGDKMKKAILAKASSLGVKRFVVACPNCYYQFKKEESLKDFEIITVYEALKDYFVPAKKSGIYTVHDSCPDRFEGIYAAQVRGALDQAGCKRVEMKHRERESICCGSSGQLGHFRPEWSKEHELQALEEAEEAGADTIIAYCHACVLNFADISPKIRILHALNVLLGFMEDYGEVKQKAGDMFTGPDALDLWGKLFEDPE